MKLEHESESKSQCAGTYKRKQTCKSAYDNKYTQKWTHKTAMNIKYKDNHNNKYRGTYITNMSIIITIRQTVWEKDLHTRYVYPVYTYMYTCFR